MNHIVEPARSVAVCGSYDVVVVGGGIAGVAAAVAAARHGRSVALVEKSCVVGGLATAGIVTIWLPICDGRGRQVIGGLAEELLHLSVADLMADNPRARFTRVPACWQNPEPVAERAGSRYMAEFNAVTYALALEKLVTDSGIALWYDTGVCGVHTAGAGIDALFVENKSGRQAIRATMVVDATGDADVCALAGEQTESLDSNVACAWYYHVADGSIVLNQMSNRYSHSAGRDGAQGPFFRGDDATDVTAQILASRQMIRERVARDRERTGDPLFAPIAIPSLPCLRMTRRLVAATSLNAAQVHTRTADTVGLTGDWRHNGPVYPIPWSTLHGVRTNNLAAAGRCMSSDVTVWDATRAIPTCALTGTIAGTACALAVGNGRNLWQIDIDTLRKTLVDDGGIVE